MNVSSLIQTVFSILSEHRVKVTSSYCSVMVAVMVLEGLGRSLDPQLDLIKMAAPHLLGAA